ncbi:MAG: hypothetical protein JOY71_15725 [Acetobacteraceae bacterium]|nr:hypothetical protein [Acetobacteraceae bacterium]
MIRFNTPPDPACNQLQFARPSPVCGPRSWHGREVADDSLQTASPALALGVHAADTKVVSTAMGHSPVALGDAVAVVPLWLRRPEP